MKSIKRLHERLTDGIAKFVNKGFKILGVKDTNNHSAAVIKFGGGFGFNIHWTMNNHNQNTINVLTTLNQPVYELSNISDNDILEDITTILEAYKP